MLQKLHNNRGSMLLISYFVVLVFLGLGAAFLTLTTNEAKVSERQKIAATAFHIAEAGLERALYDLRQDFVNASGTPSWADGDINGYAIGPDTSNFYAVPYASTTFNGGSYTVEFKNDSGADALWGRSTGTLKGASHTLEIYVKIVDVSPYDNAVFAGSGASGTMINGNVDVRGSVHILGDGLSAGDYALDIGGTAELVGNNYNGLAASLLAKVPALPTTVVGGETVSTLNAEFRVKKGLVGLSGSATVGEANVAGNSVKEAVDGIFVTDGWGGNKGTANAYSDNGTSNAYDLGDSVQFPSLSDPSPDNPAQTNKEYFESGALVLTNELSNITPASSFTYTDGTNAISMDGSGNMTIQGKIFLDGGNGMTMSKSGSDTTITYTGKGAILAEGNVQIDVNLLTSGNNSFPNNIVGVMTEGNIGFNEASIDVMGVFYAENQIIVQKQTDIMGTVISNYFDAGTNVPAIYQVPETVNNLPDGMIGQDANWYLVVSWQKI